MKPNQITVSQSKRGTTVKATGAAGAALFDAVATTVDKLQRAPAPDGQANSLATARAAEIEAVIARLGDDAARLLDANPDDAMAANLVHAAALLGGLL